MPKLKNVNEKYVNGLKVDKETKDVVYSDEAHVYIDKTDQQKYVSVTTLIGKYENPFDVFFWSSYKTCEKLMSEETFHVLKETLLATKRWTDDMIEKLHLDPIIFDKTRKEIQKGYDDERNKSCERGTKIHSNFEEMYYTSEKQDLKKFGLGGVFTCKKGYYELDLEKGVYPEFLVSLKSSDGILRVAGQIDLLIKDGNDIIIADYKTNKEIKKHSYFDKNKFSRIMMKYPLNNIEDCNFYHYSLQLSTYAYLLQQIKPELNIKKLMLIHIDHDDKITEYTVDYLKNDVERMLKHYKKLLKQTTVLDRDRPIDILNMGSIFDIIDGHVNEMFNANEGLYEERMKICKECPLYKETPVGPICNPKLYINKEGKTSAYKKDGYVRGCSCRLSAKTRLIHGKCINRKMVKIMSNLILNGNDATGMSG